MKSNPTLKKSIIVIVVLFCLAFVPYVISHSYFSGYINHIQPNTMFDANDLLSYWGTVLSAISAGILGYIAYKLNQKVLALTVADTERNKMSTVILECVLESDLPWSVPIQGYHSVEKQIQEKGLIICGKIAFKLFNIGPAPLSKTIIHYLNIDNSIFTSVECMRTLAPNSSIKEQIPLLDGQYLKLEFEFISCFNKRSFATCYVSPAGIGVSDLDTIVDFQLIEKSNIKDD